MASGIYGIKTNDELIYVGQSKNIARRWQFHKYELKNNKHKNIYLQRIYNKQKLEFMVLEYVDDTNNLTLKEIYYINTLKPKCNMTIPLPDDRWQPSAERNAKISMALLGKKKSKEHRQNISMARMGMRLNYDVWNKKRIEYNGVIDSIFGWEERLNIKHGTLNARLRRGWTVERAINTPVRFLSEGRHKK